MDIIKMIIYVVTGIFVILLGLLVYSEMEIEVQRLDYCQDIGFDGYSYECKDWMCIEKQHYCSNNDNDRVFNID